MMDNIGRKIELSGADGGGLSGVAEVRYDETVLFISDSFYDLFETPRPDEMPHHLEDLFELPVASIGQAIKGLGSAEGAVLSFGFDCPVKEASVASESSRLRHLMCTLTRTNTESVIISLIDCTETARVKEQLEHVTAELSHKEAWLEVTRGLLHDIGNAISGMSLLATQMGNDEGWEECQALSQLQSYLSAHQIELEKALGVADCSALARMVGIIKSTCENRRGTLTGNLNIMMHSVVHIGELIYLHRTYSTAPEETEKEPIDLKRVIMDSLLILHSQLEKRQVRIDIQQNTVTALIRGSRARLLSLFLNLIKNAYESLDLVEGRTEEKVITIVFACPNPEVVSVEIRDNGAGFGPEQEVRFFEKHFSTKKRLSGLGLYSCRNTVIDHGGNISIASEGVGRGATVLIEFPPLRIAS